MVSYKTNIYIEAVLKQGGFDTFIARNIINFMENQIKYEKIKSFYKFIARKDIKLIFTRNDMGLNKIEAFNFLFYSVTSIDRLRNTIKNKIQASNYHKKSSYIIITANKNDYFSKS